jgi:hypothetical protein
MSSKEEDSDDYNNTSDSGNEAEFDTGSICRDLKSLPKVLRGHNPLGKIRDLWMTATRPY